jgi:hypothetical protein
MVHVPRGIAVTWMRCAGRSARVRAPTRLRAQRRVVSPAVRALLRMRRTARSALAARNDVLSCAEAEVELVAQMVAAKEARLGETRTRRWALRRSTGCCSGGNASARRSRCVAGCSAARAGAVADVVRLQLRQFWASCGRCSGAPLACRVISVFKRVQRSAAALSDAAHWRQPGGGGAAGSRVQALFWSENSFGPGRGAGCLGFPTSGTHS